MDGNLPFRRRSYANLCREFIDAASPYLIDIHDRGDDIEDKMVALKNLAYCLRAPVPYHFENIALNIGMFISYFKWPQALLAARQDVIAIKYADSLATRVVGKEAFSSDLIKRKLPDDMKTVPALDYAQQHKLKGLERLISRALP